MSCQDTWAVMGQPLTWGEGGSFMGPTWLRGAACVSGPRGTPCVSHTSRQGLTYPMPASTLTW